MSCFDVSRCCYTRAGGNAHLLDCRRGNAEIRVDVASEYASLKRFDVAADVRLAFEQMAIVHVARRLDVTVWHDDFGTIRFHLLHRDVGQCFR